MRNFICRFLFLFISLVYFGSAFSQTRTNTELLKQISVIQAEKERIKYQQLKTLAAKKGWDMIRKDKKGNIIILVDVDAAGQPQYITTESNTIAAATIGTSALWPGGSTGLNLSGSSNSVKDKLAIWDGGKIRNTHVELTGRILQKDVPSGISDHSTHVAGTLIASGVLPQAKGMSFGQQELVAYDFSGAESEMMIEAPNILLSNHSYGTISGWYFNETQNRWEFYGLSGANEDYKFGYYSNQAQLWDSIAYNAPYYLMVKSAGNNRTETGPAVGSAYWRFDANNIMSDAGVRPAGISSNNGYDIIATYGTSKNILTVGAVNPIPNGYSKPSDVMMSPFSSWGPTDDGRIKPDVVADGIDVISSIGTADNAYANFSGTSMSTPNAAGSLLLLQEYYAQLHSGIFMRSATLKGLTIHTADEAGLSPGPDYQNGWGLMNMKKAAAVITANNTTHLIQENVLANNGTLSIPVIASGNGKISATISWTDPKAVVEPTATALNNPTPKLVNDLDIVIKKGATVYKPWILNPANPGADATTGDNILDNVEKVELSNIVPGDSYTIEIKHKGTLARGQQAYSLIASGVGGQPYCSSGATSNAGARIDSVSFANIQNKNAAGCTTYSNFTNLVGNLQPAQTIPLFVRLNSCDASAVDKIVKVFIDANNDGDFTDAGENVLTSGVINGNNDYTANLTVPAGLTPGKYSLLRIVMQETSLAANVLSCGSYTKGETQDYSILIVTPANDAGVLEITSPLAGECKTTEQYATVRIKNYGSATISNVPVSVVVNQGATTIVTLNGTFTGNITAGTDVEYTFQTPFALLAGTAYNLTATTNLAGDQLSTNNSVTTSFSTGADAAAPTGTANICGTIAVLKSTSVSSSPFNWYNSAVATSPLTTGASTSTSTILGTYYLGTGEVNNKLGPANKMVFADGGYNQFSPGIRFTTLVPSTIKTARLYIGNPGKITFALRELVSYDEATGAYEYYSISSKTINVTATVPTPPVLGAQNNDPADLGAIYYLGIDIPAAANYILVISYADGASIFRNNLITTTNYPYTIPGVISITGNSVLQSSTPAPQTYYYYLYNTTVKPTYGCPSPRTAIVATTSAASTISVVGNVLTSTSAVTYQWYLNGSPISGANSQSYTAIQSGLYKCETSDAKGCGLLSNEINVTVTAVTNVNPAAIGLVVSPNPSINGEFNIKLETRSKSNLYISVINTIGQKVYDFTIPDFVGQLSKTINPGHLASGIYYLRVQHDKKMYVKKLVITQ